MKEMCSWSVLLGLDRVGRERRVVPDGAPEDGERVGHVARRLLLLAQGLVQDAAVVRVLHIRVDRVGHSLVNAEPEH